jgi:FkbM family methyltransferase
LAEQLLSGSFGRINTVTWRNLALRVPLIANLIKRWDDHRNRDFIVGDVVLEAPKPPISRSVRKSLRRNRYETAESYLVRHLVRPGDTVLDLGSGLGLTSILAAKASGGGRVVGYEADPRIARLAENNVRKNGVGVEIRNRAIAKTKGVCEFHVRRSFPASSLFPANGSKKILIEADAFQDVVDEIQPALLVCDIEGMETQVLVSADLASIHRLVVEVHPEVTGLLSVLRCVQSLAAAGLHLVDNLCFEQVLVFDRDGSASSIEAFQSDRSAGKKTTPFREIDVT